MVHNVPEPTLACKVSCTQTEIVLTNQVQNPCLREDPHESHDTIFVPTSGIRQPVFFGFKRLKIATE